MEGCKEKESIFDFGLRRSGSHIRIEGSVTSELALIRMMDWKDIGWDWSTRIS